MNTLFSRVRSAFRAYETRTHEQASLWVLGVVSFVDSFFIVIPPEIVLAAMSYGRLARAWLYTLLASTASALGGIVAYGIGAFAYDTVGAPLAALFGVSDVLTSFGDVAAATPFLILLAIGISPFPKIPLLIGAGALAVPIVPVIGALFFARVIRYGVVSYAAALLGERALPFLRRLFRTFGWGFLLVALITLAIVALSAAAISSLLLLP